MGTRIPIFVWVAGGLLALLVPAARGQSKPGAPCCDITGINMQTGTVAAKEKATGHAFSFKVTDTNLLKSLKVGQPVYANLTTKQVSLDGKNSCCAITSDSQAAVAAPLANALSKTAPPCCSITAIGAQNLITAQTAAGKYFVFTLFMANTLVSPSPGTPPTLTVGQKVYANFTTNQVSLDGASPVGSIKYLCTAPPDQPCPAGASSCRRASSTVPGCSAVTYGTSIPASCKPGYYGSNCQPVPRCSPQGGVSSDGISGTGACTCNPGYSGADCSTHN